MQELNTIQLIAVWALPVLFAVTLHEVAHGWVARMYGDQTAAVLGRLSLNPIRHVDPVGTILVPLLMMLTAGFMFGWAKPVPVVMRNLRHPRQDMAKVAIAGPAANLVMAVFWGMLLKLGLFLGGQGLWEGLIYMSVAGIAINLILMILNLFPVPPLDGSRVLNGLLPESAARVVDRLEPYGLMIVVVLLVTGVLGGILLPIMRSVSAVLLGMLGINLQIF